MALDHVAQCAGVIVVGRAGADALGLGDGNLNVIDEARSPDWFEDRVGEPEHHQVFDGFLAEVMIDSKNLTFVEMPGELAVDLGRAPEVMDHWFFAPDTTDGTPRLVRMDHSYLLQSPYS